MVPVVFFGLFVVFALFCAGRLLRTLILPIIIIATLGYALNWAGVFGTTADAGRPRHRLADRSSEQ